MPNTQTGPYPVLFAKNTTRARINLQTTVGGTHFHRSLGPGETKEVPWVIAKSAGFHHLWTEGKIEVSDKFDFETTLDELPSIGADGGPAQWDEIEGVPEEFPPEDHTRSWDKIDGVPDAFPPESHEHAIGDVNGLQGALDSKVGSDDPRLSDDRTPTEHTHAITEITDLQASLNSKVDDTDSRLTDDRTPTEHRHSWGEIDGKPTTFDPKIGTTASTAAAGNDPRLSDTRTPKAHRHSWSEIDDKPTIPDEAPVAAAQTDSEATDVAGLVADFNELLGKLRDAGIIAS